MGTIDIATWIPLEDCKHRRLYRVAARNFTIGVYSVVNQEFFGIRHKLGLARVDSEDHWDAIRTSPPLGTAKPLEDLGIDLPENIVSLEGLGDVSGQLFDWLQKMTCQLEKSVT